MKKFSLVCLVWCFFVAQNASGAILGTSDASYTDVQNQCVTIQNITFSDDMIVDLASVTAIAVRAHYLTPEWAGTVPNWEETIFQPETSIIYLVAELCGNGWGLYYTVGYHRWKDLFVTWHNLPDSYDVTFAWSPL